MNNIVVTPLGTVSPYCKANKKCPGFLIEYNGYKVLLDCGDGISSNLNFPYDLNNLIIIISHLHKDHYSSIGSIGYASYIYKNFGYLDDKIKVYIPSGDKPKDNSTSYYYDNGWGQNVLVEKKLADFEFLTSFKDENYLTFIPYDGNLKLKHSEMDISFIQNPHQLKTYSTKIKIEDYTIVYSADTGYNHNTLTKFSKDADLLICESTFIKGQTRASDNHLYAHEAGKIAKEANVKKLLLTHFWPELDKQMYVDEAKEYFENTEAAEEGKKLVLRRNKYE